MLVFSLTDGTEVTYRIGQKQPVVPHHYYVSESPMYRDIVKVCASDEELGVILGHFVNLPARRQLELSLTVWSGDLAKFIYDNFPYHYYNKE